MTSVLKKLFVGIGVLVCLLVLLLVTAVFLLKTKTVQNLAMDSVNGMIPGEIFFEEFRFSLIKGELEFRDVRLQGPEHEPLASLDRLFVDLSWTALLGSELKASSIELDKPWVRMQIDGKGAFNLVRAFTTGEAAPEEPDEEPEQGGGGFPFNIVAESLGISQGFVSFESVPMGLKTELEGIGLSGSADLEKMNGKLALKADKGKLDLAPVRTDLSNLDLDVILDQGSANLGLESRVASGNLLLKGKAALDRMFQAGFLGPGINLDAISYNLALDLTSIRLENLLAESSGLAGTVDSGISVSGQGASPTSLTAKAEIQASAKRLSQAKVKTPLDARLQASARLEQGTAFLDRLEAEAAGSRVEADGSYELSSQAMAANIDLNAPDLALPLSVMGVQNAAGGLVLKATAGGSAGKPSLAISLQGDGLRYGEVTLGDAMIEADLDDSGELTVSRLVLENQGSSVQGEGSIRLFKDDLKNREALPLAFTAKLRDMEIRDFMDREIADGALNGELQLAGSLNALEGKLNLEGKDLSTNAVRIGDLNAEIALNRDTVRLESLEVKNRGSRLTARGHARIFEQGKFAILEDPDFELEILGKRIYLETFRENLKGVASLTARVDGTLKQPKGSVEMRARDLDLGVQKIKGVEVTCGLDRDRITVDPLKIEVAAGERIQGSGWIGLEKAFQVSLASPGISLKHIDRVRQQGIEHGKVVFRLSGEGTLEAPRGEADVSVREWKINQKDMEEVEVRLDLSDQTARVSGKLGFDLEGLYHLKSRDFSALLKFRETDLTPFLDLANRPDMTGSLTGTAEARGNAGAARQVQASADFSKLDLFHKGERFAHSRDFKVSYLNGEFSIPGLKLSLLEKGGLEIKGRGRIAGPVDLKAQGLIPMEVVSLLVEDLPEAKGEVTLSADLKGTFSRPEIRGDVEFRETGFVVPGLMQDLSALNGRIKVTPELVSLDGIRGNLDNGTFDLSGEVGLKDLVPVRADVTLKAQALPIQVPETMDLLLNSELALKGTDEKSHLQGEVILVEGLYYKNMKVSLFRLPKKKREVAPTPKEIKNKFLRNLALDISVSKRNPFLVDNNLAHLEISPDLRVGGKADHPVVSGRAKVDPGGEIYYQKKIFEVKKGVIDFVNPFEIEPTLDIRSEVKIRSWTVNLEISGTPEELIFKLTSDPPEEDQDILSLLVFGKTTAEMIEGEGGTKKTTQQMLAELIASTFGDDIKKATGLDILEVETVEEDQEEPSDRIKVTMGKKLSKRTLVKYSVESKEGEVIQTATGEYKLLENVMLNGFQDTKGSFGGGLLYRLEFR